MRMNRPDHSFLSGSPLPIASSTTTRTKTTNMPWRLDLARIPWLRPLLESRWPLFWARAFTLAGFLFTILAGFFGSPVGSHNFAIIFVWIAWWTALKLVFIPLGGRSWCSVCPIPMPGEWLQQGGLVSKAAGRTSLERRWPKRLRGYWLQAGLFLLIGIFSAVTLTDARLTSWILIGLIALAVGLSLVFERRAFCRYLCPIGGFTGLYAQSAPLELRVKASALCAEHREKTCYTNCPWGVYPLALRDNAACGLCLECLRVCPSDNLALNLRAFGSDLGAPRPVKRLDETAMALVMLSSALAFSAVFTGPWGSLKAAAYAIGSEAWWVYVGGFLALNLILLPGLYAGAVALSGKLASAKTTLRRSLSDYTQVLIPLGLFAWIAFTVSFAFPKLNYVLIVLADPFGWGWNLFGAAGLRGNTLNLASWSGYLQIALAAVGLFWSAHLTTRLAEAEDSPKPAWRRAAPVVAFCLSYSLVLIGLLIG